MKRFIQILNTLLLTLTAAAAQGLPTFTVDWHTLGDDENSSMPLGNGDIAVNAWTEHNGDIVMLIAKSDAFSENAQQQKVGRVRIALEPNPFVGRTDLVQRLSLADARLTLSAGSDRAEVWVDANHPVIHVATTTARPVTATVRTELWRTRGYHLTQEQVNENLFNLWEWRSCPDGIDFLPDSILPATPTQTSWCHWNTRSMYPVVLRQEHLGSLIAKYPDPLLHRCYGAAVTGPHFHADDDRTLTADAAATRHELAICVLTKTVDSIDEWQQAVGKLAATTARTPYKTLWQQHRRWWAQFWGRSWVQLWGDADAEAVSRGYAVNRYMVACAGRGAVPIKFNGSLFTVGHDIPEGAVSTTDDHDPDFRDWGSCFWHQNIRHIYYPLVASGDYDLLMPWLNMYTNALPLAKDRTRLYYGHGGASFIETIHFWGLPNLMDFGWDNPGHDPQSGYMRWHTQGALEVVVQMLDYFDNTQDTAYLHSRLLPFAKAIVQYYDQHWQRGADGKILFSPHQSIEMYQQGVVNPTPDIAGLRAILPRLQQLPGQADSLVRLWTRVLADVPAIPIGTTQGGKLPLRGQGDADGRPVILPAQQYGDPSNGENPELYTVFPYRNYCLGKPDLQLALNTYEARRYPFKNCWGQDGMEAALLGLTDEARQHAVKAMTTYSTTQRFPWFWAKVADYAPDMDNGGTAMMTLQLMLMQCNGREIRLLPAWPADWSATFKLHAPYNTTVEATVEQGQLKRLKVTPRSRRADVVIGTLN